MSKSQTLTAEMKRVKLVHVRHETAGTLVWFDYDVNTFLNNFLRFICSVSALCDFFFNKHIHVIRDQMHLAETWHQFTGDSWNKDVSVMSNILIPFKYVSVE